MDTLSKLRILADSAKYDASCASSGARRAAVPGGLGNSDGTGICHSYTPDGRCVSLLRVLLTNHCVFDCLFCVNRASSDVPRARFTPEEVVRLTLDFYRRNYIEGLFLSSGIIQGPDYTLGQMVQVARTLREEHRFGGYIHLKLIPGASPELVEEAGRWADRLSANIELPTAADLQALAPQKTVEAIEGAMAAVAAGSAREAEEGRPEGTRKFAPAGQSTQVVVGATPSTDREVLATSDRLYRAHGLRRVYYSAFSPIPRADARLPAAAPPLLREHRLYQADWLMRHYGFQAAELTTEEEPSLAGSHDPKLAWALRHRSFFPVDVNRAPREALLRVPGLGYRNVDRILRVRRRHRLRLEDLARLRVSLRKARPFVITADFNPEALRLDRASLGADLRAPRQLRLFTEAGEARTGEL